MKHLYVGIDVHSKTHRVALLPLQLIEGVSAEWKNVKPISIRNNLADYKRVDSLIRAQVPAIEDASIAIDFTGGHYSEPITHFLLSKGYSVFHLTPMGVKAAKERFLGEENKTDNIDAITSAYLLYLRDVHGTSLHITATSPDLESKAALLRSLVVHRHQYRKLITQSSNRLHVYLHAVFPEAEEAHFKTLLRIIPQYPTPKDITRSRGLLNIPRIPRKVRADIITWAKQTVGVPPETYKWLIQDLCRQRSEAAKKRDEIDAILCEEVRNHPYGPILLSFPSVKEIVAATIIGTVKDIKNWPSKRKFKKGMGVYGTVRQSGGKTPRNRHGLSGDRRCKHALFMACLAGSRSTKDNDFRDYYFRQMDKGKAPLQALVRSMGKMAEIMYHCLQNAESYVYQGKYTR